MDEKFIFAPIAAIQDRRLTLMQLRVLLALFSFRGKNTDVVFPKRETLSERCGYTVQNISTVTRQLVELGWLEKAGKGGFSAPCHYKITVPDLTVSQPNTVSRPNTVSQPNTKTVSGSDTSTVSGSDTRKELTNELTNELITTTRTRTREGSILNDVQYEIFVWASTHEYWHKATTSEENFLKALCSPKGGMRQQFENRFKNQSGGSNATYQPLQSIDKRKPTAVDRANDANPITDDDFIECRHFSTISDSD